MSRGERSGEVGAVIGEGFTPNYAHTRGGIIHYVEMGDGPPLLLLHQVPRSWDEFRDLMPMLADQHRVIAMDLLGFGASALLKDHSIERYAESVIDLMDELGLDEASILGHGMGGVVAVEVSARIPRRIPAMVLSATPYVDKVFRSHRPALHPLSQVELQDDGRHLMELWVRRSGFYPPARPDLLDRFVRDALLLEDQAEDGHRAISTYRMEGRTTYPGPVLCLDSTDDPISFTEVPRLHEQLADSRLEVIEGGMVPLMEHMPGTVAALVRPFFDGVR